MSQSDWLFYCCCSSLYPCPWNRLKPIAPAKTGGKWKLRVPAIKSWPEIGRRHADRGRRFSPLIGLDRDFNTFSGCLSWAANLCCLRSLFPSAVSLEQFILCNNSMSPRTSTQPNNPLWRRALSATAGSIGWGPPCICIRDLMISQVLFYPIIEWATYWPSRWKFECNQSQSISTECKSIMINLN